MRLDINDMTAREITDAFVPIEHIQSLDVSGDTGQVRIFLWSSTPLELAKEMVDDIRAANGSVKLYVEGWETYYE